MPGMRAHTRRGGVPFWGILGYPLDQLHEEVAFIAYHFHWSRQEVLTLDHAERRRWVREISMINRRMSSDD